MTRILTMLCCSVLVTSCAVQVPSTSAQRGSLRAVTLAKLSSNCDWEFRRIVYEATSDPVESDSFLSHPTGDMQLATASPPWRIVRIDCAG